jgi:nucleotide-binding universal stress UspA family protein
MHADLIVLTTHGRGGLRELLFGSIAQQVLRRGQTPTLIVRPRSDEQLAPYHCTTILVPLDGSHESETVLKLARQVALATRARLLLASVVPTVATATGDLGVSATFSPTATAAVLDLAQVDAESYLQRKAADLRREGPEVDVLVSRGWTAQQLAIIAADNSVDLVILSTHGRSGLDGTLSGSVAPQLLGEVQAPVLLVRLPKGS